MTAVVWADGTPGVAGLYARHPLWWQVTGLCLGLSVLLAVLVALDPRTFNGVPVWLKPLKFHLSLGLYFATLAWFAHLLPAPWWGSWRGRLLTWLPIAMAAFELGWITWQAGLGQASHFNHSSAFHSTMYSLMGVGAMTLVAVSAWMGVAIARAHPGWSRDPWLSGVVLGLVLTLLLGGGFGAYLGGQSSHWVGGTASDAGGLPLFSWSRDGGDLRVAHFVGMHAMQALPLLGAALTARAGRARGVWVGAGLLSLLATALFLQALAGLPLLPG